MKKLSIALSMLSLVISTSAAWAKNLSKFDVRIQVTDADGNPVAGVPFSTEIEQEYWGREGLNTQPWYAKRGWYAVTAPDLGADDLIRKEIHVGSEVPLRMDSAPVTDAGGEIHFPIHYHRPATLLRFSNFTLQPLKDPTISYVSEIDHQTHHVECVTDKPQDCYLDIYRDGNVFVKHREASPSSSYQFTCRFDRGAILQVSEDIRACRENIRTWEAANHKIYADFDPYVGPHEDQN
jgi:hypothetical protein